MTEENMQPASVQIAFSDEQLRDLVVATIASALTDEKRDNLIQKAIEELFRIPARTQYGGEPKSRIEEAFNVAVREYTQSTVKEMVATTYKKQIDEIVGKAMQDVLEKNRDLVTDKLAESVANALAKGMGRDY